MSLVGSVCLEGGFDTARRIWPDITYGSMGVLWAALAFGRNAFIEKEAISIYVQLKVGFVITDSWSDTLR